MRGSLLALVVALVVACVAGGGAGAAVVPIEGKLLISGFDIEGGSNYAYFMHGTSDSITPWPGEMMQHMVVSPLSDRIAYQETVPVPPPGAPWPAAAAVWTAAIDGTAKVNLTEVAGMVGVNCFPDWSPDASQILFQHADPEGGQRPCQAGFRLWIMDADGGNAHEVAPHVSSSMFEASWAPNAARLLCRRYEGGDINNGEAITMGADGSSIVPVPNNLGVGQDWSPNGSLLAGSWYEADVVDGDTGEWRQLRVTNVDGSNPRTLAQQFISDDDIALYVTLHPEDTGGDRVFIGPAFPKWSPKGDRIAFLAAMPFDPEGPRYEEQVEVWIYTLANGDLTKITDDLNFDAWLSWQGDNTFPDSPQVTVNNTTVTFAEVSQEGLTTILLDVDPPEAPSDQFTYDCYDIATTAGVSGDVGIRMTYTEDEIPVDALEADLAVLRYNESSEEWDDITVSRDPVNNEVYGVTSELSLFTLHGVRRSRFADVPAWGSGEGGVDPYWAFWEIDACAAAGIVGGYEDGTYQPGSAVDRATMAVYVARALAEGQGNVPAGPAEATFQDVPTDYWAYDQVEYCYAQNVVQGYTATTYAPTVQVTRDQMAVYVARALVAPTGEAALADYVPAAPRNFPDVPNTGYGDDGTDPFWAYKHIEYCVENGVVAGYLDGYYHPEYVVTRDQMAVYVARAFDLLD